MRLLSLVLCCAACSGGDDPGGGPYFTHRMFFDRDVATVPASPQTLQIIGSLRAAGGWGHRDRFDIDTSLDVLSADASTPHVTFTPTSDFFTPDCDLAAVPLPPGGHVEGESGYACDGGGDCHLLV